MGISFVAGRMLSSDLQRDSDLAFNTNLLYIDVTGNRIGVNTISPTVELDVVGNVRANNLSAIGNVTSGNITITANAVVGNIFTDGYYYANGNPVDFQQAAGSNTQLQYNLNDNFGASANLTFNANTSVLTVSGNINSGNVIANTALISNGDISALSGTITGGNVTGNLVTSNGNISAVGNVQAGNVLVYGNVNAGNLNATGLRLTGNVLSPLNTIYDITSIANITTTANVNATTVNGILFGNLFATIANVSGNVTAGNVTANDQITATTGYFTANVTGGNVLTAGIMSSTGNATHGNILTSGLISASGSITSNTSFVTGNITIPATGNVTVGNVNINNLANPTANADAATKYYVDSQIVQNANIGNLTISNTTISTGITNGNIYIAPPGAGEFVISSTSGFVIPVGNTSQRPDYPAYISVATGTLRFNTTNTQLEVWDGGNWASASGDISIITAQTINPDGTGATYTLDKNATSEGIIVTMNGLFQTPGVDYFVVTNQITFTTVPLQTDIIQVRFISSTSTITAIQNATGNAKVAVSETSANVIITGNLIFSNSSNVVTTGNITGSYIFGNGSQLTGIDATSIQNGTANVKTILNGNVTISAAGTPNVVIVTSTGANISGTLNVTGNLVVSNITPAVANLTISSNVVLGPNKFYMNPANITANTTAPEGMNSMLIGPIYIDTGVVYTQPDNTATVIL